MSRLETLREKVVEIGLIPAREGVRFPNAVYQLKVKELQDLLDHPDKASFYQEVAKKRSQKRRRKKYLKEKAIVEQFGELDPKLDTDSARVQAIFKDKEVTCLGKFTLSDYFISETGFSRSKSGYVYRVNHRKILLTDNEATFAHVRLDVNKVEKDYKDGDVEFLAGVSEDRIYKDYM